MMTSFEREMSEFVRDVSNDLGTAVTVIKTVETYDPDTQLVSKTTTSKSIRGVVSTYSEYLVGTGAVQTGDVQVLVPAADLTFEPSPADTTVTIGSSVMSVVRAEPLYVQDLVVAWQMQVRR